MASKDWKQKPFEERVQLTVQTAEMLLALYDCIKPEERDRGKKNKITNTGTHQRQSGIIYTKYSKLKLYSQ